MKKYLLLFYAIIVLLVTGCDVEYKLTLENDKFAEEVKFIFAPTDTANKKYLDSQEAYAIYNRDVQILYDKEKSNDIFKYRHTFTPLDYQESKAIENCYDKITIEDKGNSYLIDTSNEFKCMVQDYMFADKVTVKFVTPNKVYQTNADEVDNDTYIWHFDSDNKDNHPIHISVSKEKMTEEEIFFAENTNNIIFGVVIFVGLVIAIFSISAIIKRRENSQI